MSLPLILETSELASTFEALQQSGRSLSEAGICLVDLRPADKYDAEHITGAVHGNAALLNRSEPPIGGLLPEPGAVNELLAQIGANMGDQIVAYDGGRETAAARLIWVLDAYGYEVGSWLSGGFNAWQANNLPTRSQVEQAPAGNLSLSLIGDNVISAEGLMSQLDVDSVKIIDVRTPAEFAGTDVRSSRGGHIPGAKHIEWLDLMDEQGHLHDDETLMSLLSDLSQQDTIVVYCQTHQRSALTYIALKNLGFEDVRALDGAWSNWGNRADTPIE